MTTEPKLLTEADIERFSAMSRDAVTAELRERGLIAEEPEPEPLVEVELSEALTSAYFADDRNRVPWSNGFRKGFERGQFLAPRKELTREMVREALRARLGMVVSWDEAEAIAADLTEALQ